tara:strand:- start:348 stop:506 length:159 start_codon:yes stop_codon:yes gene_type:complete
MSFFRLPQSPSDWSKRWADRLVSTLELLFTQVSDSAQNSAETKADAQVWFLG